MKKYILLFIIFFTLTPLAMAALSASQKICGDLGTCFTIKNTVVNGVDYNCGDTATLSVTSVTPLSPTLNQVALTPIDVNVGTNTAGSYEVTGDFVSLTGGAYTFPTTSLSLVPPSETSTIPGPGTQLFGPFVPTILVDTTVVAGTYNGVITFTVAKL